MAESMKLLTAANCVLVKSIPRIPVKYDEENKLKIQQKFDKESTSQICGFYGAKSDRGMNATYAYIEVPYCGSHWVTRSDENLKYYYRWPGADYIESEKLIPMDTLIKIYTAKADELEAAKDKRARRIKKDRR